MIFYKRKKNQKNKIMSNKIQMRDFFIESLRNEAKKNKEILLISNEQGASALDKFRKELSINGKNFARNFLNNFGCASKELANTLKEQ